MKDPVEDRVSTGCIGDGCVSVKHGELGDEDSGDDSKPSLNELEDLISMDLRQRFPSIYAFYGSF